MTLKACITSDRARAVISTTLVAPALAPELSVQSAHSLCEMARMRAIEGERAARLRTAHRLWNARKRLRLRAQSSAKQEERTYLLKNVINVQALYEQTLERAQSDCIALVLSISRTVMGAHADLLRAALIEAVRTQLPRLIEQSPLQLHAHPSELTLIQNALTDAPLALIPNPTIPTGALEVRTISGSVTFSWHEHLEAIASQLSRFGHRAGLSYE